MLLLHYVERLLVLACLDFPPIAASNVRVAARAIGGVHRLLLDLERMCSWRPPRYVSLVRHTVCALYAVPAAPPR